MVKMIFMSVLVLFSSLSLANDQDPYFTISSVSVVPVDSSNIEMSQREETDKAAAELGQVIIILDQLIAIGKKVWPIIQAGKPVLKTDMMKSVSVIPSDNKDPRVTFVDMANWSMPTAQRYNVVFKNKLGMDVIDFDFTLYFQYNGTFQGKGKYLTSLTIEASRVWAAWAFDLDATSELVSIANVGSAKNPVASAILRLNLNTKGQINSVKSSYSIYVDGRGNIRTLY